MEEGEGEAEGQLDQEEGEEVKRQGQVRKRKNPVLTIVMMTMKRSWQQRREKGIVMRNRLQQERVHVKQKNQEKVKVFSRVSLLL